MNENELDDVDKFFNTFEVEQNVDGNESEDDIDNFFKTYDRDEENSTYPKKDEMMKVEEETEDPEENTPNITTQYMMGLLSKTNDEDTHMDNALKVFNKNGYEIIDRKKTAGLGIGDPDSYKYRLRKMNDDGSIGEDDFWLDEGSWKQAIWNEVGDIGEYIGGGIGATGAVITKKPSLFIAGKQAGNAFDQFLSHMITGEELSSTERAYEAGKTAALTITELYGAKAVGAAAKAIKGNKSGTISTEAETVIKELGLDMNEWNKKLENVPLKDQAKVVAQQSGGKGSGFMSRALGQDESARINYIDELTARKKAVEETIGVEDFQSIKKNTENEYGAMKKYASSIVTGNDGYDLEGYSGRLLELSDLSSTKAAKERIEIIANQLAKYPLSSLEDMIDLRQVINYEFGKSTTGKSRKQWKELKDNLDEYMGKTFSPEDMKIVDDSISSYARMKNQEELIEILDKPSVSPSLGKGSDVGEVGAVNWARLHKEVRDAGLDSPEVKNVLKISKSFMDKFGDMDANLFGRSIPKGDVGEAQTIAGTVEGHLRVLGVRKLFNFVMRQVSPRLKAQHSIYESIKNADTQADFVLNVIKNKNTPKSVKDRFRDIATKNHLNRASVNRSKFISRKAEESTKKLQDKVQKTSIGIDKKNMAIDNIDTSISKLVSKMAKRKTQRGKIKIQEQIKIQNKKKSILQKEKQMLERDHADLSAKYESSLQQVEELSMFTKKKTSATKSKETTVTYPKKKIVKVP